MKKQTAAIVSFSALLTLSAFAPKVFWQANQDNINRLPASEEAITPPSKSVYERREITPPKKSLYEMREMDHKIKEEIKDKTDDASVQCMKEKQPKDLEAEIKKLMKDKEDILKEIADLKKDKKEPREEKEEKKDKKVSRFTETEDFVGLYSQMTSMMISQQQQQTMLVQQMFTMMNMQMQQMPQQMSAQQQSLMNPYSYNFPQAAPVFGREPSMFDGYSQNIGISYQSPAQSQQGQAYQNPYAIQVRSPSAQVENGGYPQSNTNIQSAVFEQTPMGNASMNNPIFYNNMPDTAFGMQRMQF